MSRRPSLPYASATSGDKALSDLQKVLEKFGCQQFGTMTDAEQGETVVHFKWRDRTVSLRASWKGYAEAWMRASPWHPNSRRTRQQHIDMALAQAKVSVCSVLRDWVKGQVVAVECGIMSFEAAFMPHMLLSSGERVIDKLEAHGGFASLEHKQS